MFIRGKSIRSAVVRLFEAFEGTNDDYSHVGIVVLANGQAFIVHANPGHDTTDDRVIKERWDAVISSNRIAAASVFRLADQSTARRLGTQASNVALQFEKKALRFDHDFNLVTPQKLYCTELVWRAYMTVGIDLRGRFSRSGKKYLFPSDLIRSGLLRQIFETRSRIGT